MTFHILVLLLAQLVPAAPTVPAPAPIGKLYTGEGIIFSYPNNWEVFTEKNSPITICPRSARLLQPNGSHFVTHGMFLGLFQPAANTDLKTTSNDLFRSFQKSNPGMLLESQKTVQTKGHDTYLMEYTNAQVTSPFGKERGVLATVQERHGIWYLFMFAPDTQADLYRAVFTSMWKTIALVVEPAVQPTEHGAQIELVRRVTKRLQDNQFKMPAFRVFVEDAEIINAYSLPEYNVVIVPSGIVHFLEDDEGELAFLIAHELGHVHDDECKTLIRNTGGNLTLEQSRNCESRADDYGLQFIMGANYNPFDAAASFGRIMMFTGETDPIDIMLKRYSSDHPVNLDRIAALRKTMKSYCTRYPLKCPAFVN